MTTCALCQADTASETLIPSYETELFGLPVIIQNAVLHHVCPACGFDGIEIPDVEGLEQAIALARVMDPAVLTGADIRFLRKACGMTGKRFAEALGCQPETLSRWENGSASQGSHGSVSDRTIRQTVWGLLFREVPAIDIAPDHFQTMTVHPGPAGRIVMERVRLKNAVTREKSTEWDLAA